jgi:glutamate-1-semialdehyde aminotransferase
MPKTGQELYQHARRRIPGGTQLLSKRPEMLLPEQWPTYYSRAAGSAIWDLDGNRYIDMSYSGIGSCILGYADHDVDAAVRAAIAKSMSTLNCAEEVELADLLCELHPWAAMVRYARCGGEAMAVAARIARAHTHKVKGRCLWIPRMARLVSGSKPRIGECSRPSSSTRPGPQRCTAATRRYRISLPLQSYR